MAEQVCRGCGHDQFKLERFMANAKDVIECVRCGRRQERALSITTEEKNAAIVESASNAKTPYDHLRRDNVIDESTTEGRTLRLQQLMGSDWLPDGKRLATESTKAKGKGEGRSKNMACEGCGKDRFTVLEVAEGTDGKTHAAFTCESCGRTRNETFAGSVAETRAALEERSVEYRRAQFWQEVERRMAEAG